MAWPSITSISRAQADGQSCGQVEWRMSILACWFMLGGIARNCRFGNMLIGRAVRLAARGSRSGTGLAANRSMIASFRSASMNRLKWLAGALLSGVLIAAPSVAQAADYAVRRHHHRHHNHRHV